MPLLLFWIPVTNALLLHFLSIRVIHFCGTCTNALVITSVSVRCLRYKMAAIRLTTAEDCTQKAKKKKKHRKNRSPCSCKMHNCLGKCLPQHKLRQRAIKPFIKSYNITPYDFLISNGAFMCAYTHHRLHIRVFSFPLHSPQFGYSYLFASLLVIISEVQEEKKKKNEEKTSKQEVICVVVGSNDACWQITSSI